MQDQAAKQGQAGAGLEGLESLLGGANMAEIQQMWAEALEDPEMMAQMEQMGEEFTKAMEQLAKMSPEELEKQMQDALGMLTEGSMVDTVLEKREEIIQQLEATNAVPPEELARFKRDPEYFELKMRESFDQMKDIFQDPEYLKMATEALGGQGMEGLEGLLGGLGGGAGGLDSMFGSLAEDLNDDTKIEEARLSVLKGDNPLLSQLFESDEMKEILHDPVKWRETLKSGMAGMLNHDEL